MLAAAVGVEGQLRFAGLIGLEDAVRDDSRAVVKAINDVGVRVVMVTGDNALTARAVAQHSRIKEMFLGSTAFKILHSARVPVLLFRLELVEQAGKEECRAVCNDVFRHVLHPTDFSKTSERAYQYLEHVVKETHCAVTLLHVT